MPRHAILPPAVALALLLVAAAGAEAQVGAPSSAGCRQHIGEASGPTREAALQFAYEGILEVVDPRLRRAWAERGRRIGDAPGYQVRKIGSRCTARGGGQFCQIDLTLCRG